MSATLTTTADERRPRNGRGLVGHLLNGILNLAAIGGTICIVLVILALVFDISLILFRTGSMSPAIPQGSLAVVREVPASEIAVGDVVTVDREDQLPVTHRVTSLEPLGGEQWRITMQGDANPTPDPAPYTVTTVREVLFSIPGLAKPVAALNSPYVLGGVTLAVSALVIWALWPRPRRARGVDEPAADVEPPDRDLDGDGAGADDGSGAGVHR